MVEFDSGPSKSIANHFAALPSYAPHRDLFWYDWGPVFYRGRLDMSARLLCIASDPGPTERIACRTLVGDAGQRVQGFLTKLGLTRSYALVNAFAYALLPSRAQRATPMLSEPAHLTWRNALLDKIAGPQLQAVVAFGLQARVAVGLWDSKPDVPVLEVPHPSSRDATKLVDAWRDAITQLRGIVTPDPDGDPTGPNYGTKLTEADYAPHPATGPALRVARLGRRRQLGRTARPKHNNSVERPGDDLLHTLLWHAPTDRP